MFPYHYFLASLALFGPALALPKGGGGFVGGGFGGGGSGGGVPSFRSPSYGSSVGYSPGSLSSGSVSTFGKVGGFGSSYGGGLGGGSRSYAPVYAGAGLLLGTSAGYNAGGHSTNSGLANDGSSLDCNLAKQLNLRPKVDCQYTWEHWFDDNHLYYVIRIDPSGQNSIGWFQGIYDNIKGECGVAPDCGLGSGRSCFDNMAWNPRVHNGSWLYGLEAAYKISDWVEGDDQTTCITTAIQQASCGIDLDFVNGKCYKKKGSFLVPYQIET